LHGDGATDASSGSRDRDGLPFEHARQCVSLSLIGSGPER
jgi:hypothetical protein